MARISTAEHAALGWRMGELAADFELLDAWALPAIGTAEEFPDLVAIWDRVGDPEARSKSSATDKLFAVRTKLGEWFGWDDNLNELPIPGCTEISLRDRLPDDLKPLDHSPGVGLFLPVFSTDREWVGELSNGTVHAAAHLGWVLREDGSFEGRLAVHAKTRGRFGGIYMKLIAPFVTSSCTPPWSRASGANGRNGLRSASRVWKNAVGCQRGQTPSTQGQRFRHYLCE